MLNQVSQVVILALSAVVCALSAWGMLAPDRMMKFVSGAMEKNWGIYFAVVIRLVLGAALIIAATDSRFPVIFEILGWIAIVAAVALLFLGRERLRRFVAWFDRMPQAMIRVWLIFGVAFGAFLVYGIV